MIRLRDLTKPQVRMLAFLDDHQPEKDAVGRRFAEMEDWRVTVSDELIALGLAELKVGPAIGGGTVAWIRLTERGRKVRDVGAA